MRVLGALIGLFALSSTAIAQGNVIPPQATCAQLEAAAKTVNAELNQDNYAEVLAKTYLDNKLLIRRDGQTIPYEMALGFMRDYSKYDPAHFVVIMMGDLAAALKERRCAQIELTLRWSR